MYQIMFNLEITLLSQHFELQVATLFKLTIIKNLSITLKMWDVLYCSLARKKLILVAFIHTVLRPS